MDKKQPLRFANRAAQLLFSLHASELYWAAASGARKCQELFRIFPDDETERVVASSAVHDLAIQIIGHADSVRKTLFNDTPRRPGENGRSVRARQLRCAELQTLAEGLALNEIRQSSVRNRFAHFDEYLDRIWMSANRSHQEPSENRSQIIYFNMAASSMRAIESFVRSAESSPLIMRVYTYRDRKYYNSGHIVDIGRLHEEFDQLQERLLRQTRFEVLKQGGSIIALSPEAFEDLHPGAPPPSG